MCLHKNSKQTPIQHGWFIFLTLLAGLSVLTSPVLAKDDPQARKIMQQLNDRDDGDNRVSDMVMVLIDKNGNRRERQILSYTKDKGEDTQSLMFFKSPADVRDTGFLTYDYDDEAKDDDQWLYLPALRKTKRIASDDKSGSFMGSDLTYYDMVTRDLKDYDFELLKETQVHGRDAWLIRATPRNDEVIDESGYTKSLLFIDKEAYVLIRALHYVKEGNKQKYFDVRGLEKIEGIWTVTKIHVATKKNNYTEHETELEFKNIRYNQEVEESLFTTRRLEKGL